MRWFFIMSGVLIFMLGLLFIAPFMVLTPAFYIPGLGAPFYWGFFEVIVLTYFGSRVCK